MERKVKYSYEFKLECVELVLKKHLSCDSVSKRKGPDASNIGNIGLDFTKNMAKQIWCQEKTKAIRLILS